MNAVQLEKGQSTYIGTLHLTAHHLIFSHPDQEIWVSMAVKREVVVSFLPSQRLKRARHITKTKICYCNNGRTWTSSCVAHDGICSGEEIVPLSSSPSLFRRLTTLLIFSCYHTITSFSGCLDLIPDHSHRRKRSTYSPQLMAASYSVPQLCLCRSQFPVREGCH